eukprot:140711-Prorocentrum_minimum.AAC.8
MAVSCPRTCVACSSIWCAVDTMAASFSHPQNSRELPMRSFPEADLVAVNVMSNSSSTSAAFPPFAGDPLPV